jgi:UDP-N-acetylmuramoylalanine--D-glutamate ligase
VLKGNKLKDMRKKLVVIGAGESGTGAAVLGATKGWKVFVTDNNNIKNSYKEILNEYKIEWEEGKHSIEKIYDADLVVKSPGVPETIPLIKDFVDKGIPVIDEIEFAYRYTDAKMICITGSNGKTTTTLLTYHILKKAGLDVGLAGNVGNSLAYQVVKHDHSCYVVELSSFQLDGMYNFKADFSVIMNITPDHLDRYEFNISNYIASKFRITNNMTDKGVFSFCEDDALTIENIDSYTINANKAGFSLNNLCDNSFEVSCNDKKLKVSVDSLALKGTHNIYNSMAASLACLYMNVDEDIIKEGLSDFKAVEHRLEPVCKVNDVLYINDSKATNVNSCWYALESIRCPIVWIAGGKDKGNDYSLLDEFVESKIKALICLGKDNTKLIETFSGKIKFIEEARTTDEAVKKASDIAEKGDVVLLSPCCASFDLFDSYIDRGIKFKESVLKLNNI